MSRIFTPFTLGLAFIVLFPAPENSFAVGCGTYSLIQRQINLRAQGKALPKPAAASLPGRTLSTLHFAIHYTMGRNVNRPRITAQDSIILRQADSVYNSLPSSFSATQRDQAVNEGLDSIRAPHPMFVQKAALYFERAWSYYSDTLGMNMPQGGSHDPFFLTSFNSGKYNVDIADITTMDSQNGGATYGLTYPPSNDTTPYSSSILLENDFLYNASVDPNTGSITGTSIKSIVNGQVIRDYAGDWEMGIKVTASHEFYHAVQYMYTPDLSPYHAWYELSATGMEERLAPEVNDYFQYLPCLFQHHHDISLLNYSSGVCPLSLYGEGVFHQFLSRDLGRAFDVQVWRNLSQNGNNLPDALTAMATNLGSRWDTLYASYSAALSAAGRTGSTSTCTSSSSPIFLSDLPCWPIAAFDTLPALQNSQTLTVPPLTFRSVRPAAMGKIGSVSLTGLSEAERVGKTALSFTAVALPGNSFSLLPSEDSSVLSLTIPNPSFSATGQITLSSRPQSFVAFPNPVTLSNARVSFFAPPGATAPLTLTVVSESGLRMVELALDTASGSSWNWNLKDGQSRSVPPGVYYYRVSGQPVKSLLILPR